MDKNVRWEQQQMQVFDLQVKFDDNYLTLKCTKHEQWEDVVLPAPEKGQIDDGCERIDKLQNKGFDDEALFEALVCLWNLWKIRKHVA